MTNFFDDSDARLLFIYGTKIVLRFVYKICLRCGDTREMQPSRRRRSGSSDCTRVRPASVDIVTNQTLPVDMPKTCFFVMVCVSPNLLRRIESQFDQVTAYLLDNHVSQGVFSLVQHVAQKIRVRYDRNIQSREYQRIFNTPQDTAIMRDKSDALTCALVSAMNIIDAKHLSWLKYWEITLQKTAATSADTFMNTLFSGVPRDTEPSKYQPNSFAHRCDPAFIQHRRVYVSDLQTWTRDPTWTAGALDKIVNARGDVLPVLGYKAMRKVAEMWDKFSCINKYLAYIERFTQFLSAVQAQHNGILLTFEDILESASNNAEIKSLLITLGEYHEKNQNPAFPPPYLANVTKESYDIAHGKILHNDDFKQLAGTGIDNNIKCAAFILAAHPDGHALMTLVVTTFMKQEGIPLLPPALTLDTSETFIQKFQVACNEVQDSALWSTLWYYLRIGAVLLTLNGYGNLFGACVSSLFYTTMTTMSLQSYGIELGEAIVTKYIAKLAPDVTAHVMWLASLHNLCNKIRQTNFDVAVSAKSLLTKIECLTRQGLIADIMLEDAKYTLALKPDLPQLKNNVIFTKLMVDDIKKQVLEKRNIYLAMKRTYTSTRVLLDDIHEWMRRLIKFNDRRQIQEMCSILNILSKISQGFTYYIRAEYHLVATSFSVLFSSLPMSHMDAAIDSLGSIEACGAHFVNIMVELATDLLAHVYCYSNPNGYDDIATCSSVLSKSTPFDQIRGTALACYVAYFYVVPTVDMMSPICSLVAEQLGKLYLPRIVQGLLAKSDSNRDVIAYRIDREKCILYFNFGYNYLIKSGELPLEIIKELVPKTDVEECIFREFCEMNGNLEYLIYGWTNTSNAYKLTNGLELRKLDDDSVENSRVHLVRPEWF